MFCFCRPKNSDRWIEVTEGKILPPCQGDPHPSTMAQRVGEDSGGRARRCGLVGDTGSLPRGHWRAMAVADPQQDVVRDSLC